MNEHTNEAVFWAWVHIVEALSLVTPLPTEKDLEPLIQSSRTQFVNPRG